MNFLTRACLVVSLLLSACTSGEGGSQAPGAAGTNAQGGSSPSAGSAGASSAGTLDSGGAGTTGSAGAPPAAGGSAGTPSAAGSGGMTEPLAYFDFSAGDARGHQGDPDFSPGRFKGECDTGQLMTGLSFDASCVSPKVLQCQPKAAWTAPGEAVHPNCGDARRDDSTGDWDNGFRKGECGASEAVVGLSRDADGAVYDLLCASAGPAIKGPGACTMRNVNAGDNRGQTASGEWSAASWKTECAAGEYVKGVSLDAATRHPHAILCCAGGGAAKVSNELKPTTGASTCKRAGANATLTPFDQAHLSGSARNVYASATFPEQGTYERITMTFTLSCPAAGCDPWDRWGNIGIVTKKNESDPGNDQILELGRFVTPYGVGGTFTYDLTDLRPALKGKLELRIFTDTWVDGWLATVKIEMKGGVPAREPAFVQSLWNSPHVGVGVPSRPVSNDAPNRQITVPESICGLGVRAIITGHGQGNRDNCSEFCPKTHFFKVNGKSHGSSVWREDCATTAVQGQHGTFTYSRAGWCPGADVRAIAIDVGGDVSMDAKAKKAAFPVAYDVEGYDNTCRPDNCNLSACVFGTACAYDNGAHTEPYYALTAVLIGYR